MQRDVDSVGGMSRAYSNASEGHAADKAALQGFAKTRDVASSPLKPVQDEQSSKVRKNNISIISELWKKMQASSAAVAGLQVGLNCVVCLNCVHSDMPPFAGRFTSCNFNRGGLAWLLHGACIGIHPKVCSCLQYLHHNSKLLCRLHFIQSRHTMYASHISQAA